MGARMDARRSLELDLRKALGGCDEFELVYQPQLNLSHPPPGRMRGPDPLASSRTRGTVSPA